MSQACLTETRQTRPGSGRDATNGSASKAKEFGADASGALRPCGAPRAMFASRHTLTGSINLMGTHAPHLHRQSVCPATEQLWLLPF